MLSCAAVRLFNLRRPNAPFLLHPPGSPSRDSAQVASGRLSRCHACHACHAWFERQRGFFSIPPEATFSYFFP